MRAAKSLRLMARPPRSVCVVRAAIIHARQGGAMRVIWRRIHAKFTEGGLSGPGKVYNGGNASLTLRLNFSCVMRVGRVFRKTGGKMSKLLGRLLLSVVIVTALFGGLVQAAPRAHAQDLCVLYNEVLNFPPGLFSYYPSSGGASIYDWMFTLTAGTALHYRVTADADV